MLILMKRHAMLMKRLKKPLHHTIKLQNQHQSPHLHLRRLLNLKQLIRLRILLQVKAVRAQ